MRYRFLLSLMMVLLFLPLVSATYFNETHGLPQVTNPTTTGTYGWNFTVSSNITIISASIHPNSTASSARIIYPNGTIITTGTASSGVVNFTRTALVSGTRYVVDSTGSGSYSVVCMGPSSPPYAGTAFTWTGQANGCGSSTRGGNINYLQGKNTSSAVATTNLTIRVKDLVTNNFVSGFCVDITDLNQSSCTTAGSSSTSLMTGSDAGVNGETYLTNFQDIVNFGLDTTGFNTTVIISNGTDNLLWVPWYDSSTACGVSNLQTTTGVCSSVNSTKTAMVSDEFSEVGLALAMSNRTDEFHYWYNTLHQITSKYGSLPAWQACADYSSGTAVINNETVDTASDGTARIIKALLIASLNDDVTSANQTLYANLAGSYGRDHVSYEFVTGSWTSDYGSVTILPMSGGNCASGGSPGGCAVDYYTGYDLDEIQVNQALCARESNDTYCQIARNVTAAMLSVRLQNDTDGDGWGVSPFNFNWDVTGNIGHIDGGGVNTYFYSPSNEQWDTDDSPRGRICDALRSGNITEGSLVGVYQNLSNYCEDRSKSDVETATTSCLQFHYNGTCSTTIRSGYYENGLGGLDNTWYNTSIVDDKVDETLTHYSYSTKTFDSTSCGTGLTYRTVRPTKLLGIAIGLEDDIYVVSSATTCDLGNTPTIDQKDIELTLVSPGNGSEQTETSTVLNVTIVNRNVTTNSTPGSLPQSLFDHTFESDDESYTGYEARNSTSGDAFIYEINSFSDDTVSPDVNWESSGYAETNLTLKYYTSNTTNTKIYPSTACASRTGTNRFNLEDTGSGTQVQLKADRGGFSSSGATADNQNLTLKFQTNWTNSVSRGCIVGVGCTNWETFTAGAGDDDCWSLDPGTLNGPERIFRANGTQNLDAYNITSVGNTSMNVTIFDSSDGSVLVEHSNVANNTQANYTWEGLVAGTTYQWYVNVVTENNNETFPVFSFDRLASTEGATITYCTEDTIINDYNTTGLIDILVYNITGGHTLPTYFNVSLEEYNYTSSTTLVANTSQARIFLRATTLFLENTIQSFNATNNRFANTSTTGGVWVPASNGSNTISVNASGNYTQQGSCSVTTPLSLNNCTVEGVHDAKYNFTAYDLVNSTSINTFSIRIRNETLILDNTTNTTTGIIVFNLLRGYNYTVNFESDSYESKNINVTTNQSNQNYNFTVYPAGGMNLTIAYEANLTIASAITVNIEIISDTFNNVSNTTTGSQYYPALGTGEFLIKYSASGYTTRFAIINISPDQFIERTVYLVDSSSVSNITLTVIDETADPVEGATVQANKYYASIGQYILVDEEKTDSNGETLLDLTKFTELYYFTVIYQGRVELVTEAATIKKDDITLQIQVGEETLDVFNRYNDLSYGLTFDSVDNQYEVTYNSLSGISTRLCLYAYRVRANGESLYNSTCSVGSVAGSFTVGVLNTSSAVYRGDMYTTDSVTGEQIYLKTLWAEYPGTFNTGLTGLFWQLIISIVAFAVSIRTPRFVLLSLPLSLVLGKLLMINLFTWGTIFSFLTAGFFIFYWVSRE